MKEDIQIDTPLIDVKLLDDSRSKSIFRNSILILAGVTGKSVP